MHTALTGIGGMSLDLRGIPSWGNWGWSRLRHDEDRGFVNEVY